MKTRRIALKVFLLAYFIQVGIAIYFITRPIAIRALPGTPVTAKLKKDIGPLHFVPLLGFAILALPENYHMILTNGHEEKSLGIDTKADLPIDDLKAVIEGNEIVVIRQSTSREIARLTSAKTGQ